MTTMLSRTEPPAEAQEVVRRERRAARRARVLGELLERRPDLAGVHPAADLATESIRWSA